MSTAAKLAELEMDAGTERSQPRAPTDVAAWFDEALPRIFGYLLPRVGNRTVIAEDLTQETLLVAFKSSSCPTDRSAVMPWLFGIARHKLMDHYRREDRERRQFGRPVDPDEVDIGPSLPLPVLDLDRLHIRDAVIVTLDKLPARQRSALVIRYLDGCDVPTTADFLGISIHAAESLLARARTSFRLHYRALNGDAS